jgi:hypothetical protein
MNSYGPNKQRHLDPFPISYKIELPSVPRKSFRLEELAARHSVSVGFLYKEANAGRLRIRKAGAASIVTVEDEAAWLAAMPILGSTNSAA